MEEYIIWFIIGVVVNTIFDCVFITYRNKRNKITKIDFNKVEIQNKVNFYITADKNESPSQFKLWLDKPCRNIYTECWTSDTRTSKLLANTKESLEHYGLKPSDYNFVTWEIEPVKTILNLND